ncbi:MAG: transposase-like protein, partial [Candidatus Deianiraeaceae bacterium]
MIFHSMKCKKCKKCGVNFTKNIASKPLYLKRLALELYLEGLGFRSISRILKVSHVSIYNWIRKFGQKAKELRKNDEISVVEIDEMHTYIGSKKTQL